MGWFSDLFNRKPYGPDIAFNCNVPMPKVKAYNEEQSGVILPKGAIYVQPKDISEPVYAIVKAMQERPSSFKTKVTSDSSEWGVFYTYKIRDVLTKQEIIVSYYKNYITLYYSQTKDIQYTYSWDWLTSDEKSFLESKFKEVQEVKIKRLRNIKNIRLVNKNNKERAAMKAIYK